MVVRTKAGIIAVCLLMAPGVALAEEKKGGMETERRTEFQSEPSEPRARMGEISKEVSEAEKTLQRATESFRSVMQGAHGEVPARVRSAAKCVTVFPEIITGAVVVGGSRGKGVSSCRTEGGEWSAPAFVNITGGSLGVALGGKADELVLFHTDDKAVSALKRGRFGIGADVSAVAGNFDAAVDTAPRGIVAYHKSGGAYAGASITAGTISTDEKRMREYYGKPVDLVSVLEGREKVTMTTAANDFVQALPKA